MWFRARRWNRSAGRGGCVAVGGEGLVAATRVYGRIAGEVPVRSAQPARVRGACHRASGARTDSPQPFRTRTREPLPLRPRWPPPPAVHGPDPRRSPTARRRQLARGAVPAPPRTDRSRQTPSWPFSQFRRASSSMSGDGVRRRRHVADRERVGADLNRFRHLATGVAAVVQLARPWFRSVQFPLF